MGSVYVSWEGTCRDRDVQDELVGCLRELADRSAARLAGPAPLRPAFLEAMTAPREGDSPPVEAVREFDSEIAGRIVLDPCLARDGQALHDDVQRTGTEMVSIEAGGLEKNETFCLNLDPSGAQWCLRLPRLGLRGIDFRLFDPRGLYPQADRMSFVFLESPELPALDGCLAQVETRDQCRAYGSETIRAADWFVSAPRIHLRYYLEEWSDFLLSWVKFFFVPDLHWQRYEALSQYEAFRAFLEENSREHGVEASKWTVFRFLIEKFDAEADEWGRKMSAIP